MIALKMDGFIIDQNDGLMLKRFIETNVGAILAGMAKDCFVPRVSILFKELMARTNTDEKMLLAHSKNRYPQYKFHLLHDPYTTLLILITEYFLTEKKDEHAARMIFNLFALRNYSNLLFRFLPKLTSGSYGCNPNYWRAGLEALSHSHLFRSKQTIGNSILYLSQEVFSRYRMDIIKDRPEPIMKMIMLIRSRIFQSMRSFFGHYYKAKQQSDLVTSRDQDEVYDQKETFEQKIKLFSDRVAKDICVYGKINEKAINESTQITKFNKKFAIRYVKTLQDPQLSQQLDDIFILLFRGLVDFKQLCGPQFIDHVKRLMSVKTSTKPVYFKKLVVNLHDEFIIPKLGLQNWFNSLSIQTKKVSRDFVAYYLALFIRSSIC